MAAHHGDRVVDRGPFGVAGLAEVAVDAVDEPPDLGDLLLAGGRVGAGPFVDTVDAGGEAFTRLQQVVEVAGEVGEVGHVGAEITQLVLRERQGRDRGWWEQMAACYHAQSMVAPSRWSPPVVQVNGDRAVVEAPATIELRTSLDGVEADLVSYARLLYRIQRHAATWQIHELTCIYERDTLTPAVSGTVLNVEPERLKQFRAPYRYLGYQLALTGRTVGDDLYGDDYPDRVTDLYRSAFDWLGR